MSDSPPPTAPVSKGVPPECEVPQWIRNLRDHLFNQSAYTMDKHDLYRIIAMHAPSAETAQRVATGEVKGLIGRLRSVHDLMLTCGLGAYQKHVFEGISTLERLESELAGTDNALKDTLNLLGIVQEELAAAKAAAVNAEREIERLTSICEADEGLRKERDEARAALRKPLHEDCNEEIANRRKEIDTARAELGAKPDMELLTAARRAMAELAAAERELKEQADALVHMVERCEALELARGNLELAVAKYAAELYDARCKLESAEASAHMWNKAWAGSQGELTNALRQLAQLRTPSAVAHGLLAELRKAYEQLLRSNPITAAKILGEIIAALTSAPISATPPKKK